MFMGETLCNIKVYIFNIALIVNLPTPSSQKDMRRFLGHAGYYIGFIRIFTRIASRLFKLLAKDAKFYWDTNCEVSFKVLYIYIYTTLVLRGTNWKFPFHISTNASKKKIGAVLGQK
jgi:hypothetical protein